MMNRSLLLEKLRLKIFYKINLLDVDNKVIEVFRKYVKNNKFLDDYTIIKKINRDWILAKDTEYIEYDSEFEICIRNYGNLTIKCCGNKIIDIYNRKGKKQDFKIDKELKEELNKIMRL